MALNFSRACCPFESIWRCVFFSPGQLKLPKKKVFLSLGLRISATSSHCAAVVFRINCISLNSRSVSSTIVCARPSIFTARSASPTS